MKKSDEIASSTSCLNKAHADEPLFVLRANDPIAPQVVRYWAHLAATTNSHEFEKARAAVDVALEMEDWQEGRREAIMASNNPQKEIGDASDSPTV